MALAPTPYTTLSATASADAVDEGADVEIRATMSGRARPAVVLHVREAGDTDWRQETMDAADGDVHRPAAEAPRRRPSSSSPPVRSARPCSRSSSGTR